MDTIRRKWNDVLKAGYYINWDKFEQSWLKLVQVQDTFCPVFTGYYPNHISDPNIEGELYNVNKDRESNGLSFINEELLDFNYHKWQVDCAKAFCDYIEQQLKDNDFDVKIQFQKLVSPREYNFANDSINCSIYFSPIQVERFLNDNMDDFNQYIRDKYTSCSGFISHYSNDSKDWINDFIHEHKTGSVFDFICKKLEIEEMWFSPGDYDLNEYDYVEGCDLDTLITENDRQLEIDWFENEIENLGGRVLTPGHIAILNGKIFKYYAGDNGQVNITWNSDVPEKLLELQNVEMEY